MPYRLIIIYESGELMKALEAATRFVEKYFDDCLVALLAGSVVREEATSTSDLDIVIITSNITSAYRESFYDFGWPIEVFVHTEESYKEFFKQDVNRRRPSLPKMCSEGIIIKDKDGLANIIKNEADFLLTQGLQPYSIKEAETKRYFITDMLDDLIGATSRPEELFIINELSADIANFMLVNNDCWEGKGKWIPRNIKRLDEDLYLDFMNALNEFYQNGNKNQFINFVERELNKYGGRLFEGYSVGK